MTADDIVIEHLRPGDHENRHVLRAQAFGMAGQFDPDAPTLPGDQVVAAYRGDTLLGTVVTLDFTLHLNGGPIRCGGVSGVIVAPEARGRGLARRMNAAALDEMAERGQPVASLYPTTASLYRSVGYEVAGWWQRRALLLGALAAEPAGWDWQRTTVDDPALYEIDAAQAATFDGGLGLDPGFLAMTQHRWRTDKRTHRYAYLGQGPGDRRAALVYAYAEPDGHNVFYEIDADILAGTDGAALAAALGFLAGHGTTAAEIRTTLPDVLLTPHVPQMQRGRVAAAMPWMVRLVDVPAALTARRYPTSVSGSVVLTVTDPLRPANEQAGRLEIDGGLATWEPVDDAGVSVTVSDLAGLYTGFQSPSVLAAAGRLDGAGTADRDLLMVAFAGRPQPEVFF